MDCGVFLYFWLSYDSSRRRNSTTKKQIIILPDDINIFFMAMPMLLHPTTQK
jgi:hypothetical protein